MALVPGAGREVVGEPRDAGVDQRLVEQRAAGDAGAHGGVEVRLGPGPVRGEESVLAVGRDRDRLDADAAERLVELGERRAGELLVGERPRAGTRRSARSGPGPPGPRSASRPGPRPAAPRARPARQSVQWWTVKIARAASNAPSGNGQVLGDAPRGRAPAPGWRCASITGDGSIAATTRPGGLVGAGPAADVHDAPGAAERGADPGLDPGIRRAGSPCTSCRSCRSAGSSPVTLPSRAAAPATVSGDRGFSVRCRRPCKDHPREDRSVGGNRTGGQGLGGPARRRGPRGAGRIAGAGQGRGRRRRAARAVGRPGRRHHAGEQPGGVRRRGRRAGGARRRRAGHREVLRRRARRQDRRVDGEPPGAQRLRVQRGAAAARLARPRRCRRCSGGPRSSPRSTSCPRPSSSTSTRRWRATSWRAATTTTPAPRS